MSRTPTLTTFDIFIEPGNFAATVNLHPPSLVVLGVQEKSPENVSMDAWTASQVFSTPYWSVAESQEKVAPEMGVVEPEIAISVLALKTRGTVSKTEADSGIRNLVARDSPYAVNVVVEPDLVPWSSPADRTTWQRSTASFIEPDMTADDPLMLTSTKPGQEFASRKILEVRPGDPANLIMEQVVDPTDPVFDARTDLLSQVKTAELGADRTGEGIKVERMEIVNKDNINIEMEYFFTRGPSEKI